MGTAGYMSPEQVRGEKLDARTDLFSFGLVLYEMATGQRAFSGDTAAIVHDAILNQTPAPVRELNSTTTAEAGSRSSTRHWRRTASGATRRRRKCVPICESVARISPNGLTAASPENVPAGSGWRLRRSLCRDDCRRLYWYWRSHQTRSSSPTKTPSSSPTLTTRPATPSSTTH